MLPESTLNLIAATPDPALQPDPKKSRAAIKRCCAAWQRAYNASLQGTQRTGIDEVFAAGHDRAAVIGSDCIDIETNFFETAWCALEGHDCVIGPAMDGGYYLLALRRPCPGMFEKITWSSDSTLLETLQRARELGLNVFLLPLKSDVDTERDWLSVRARFEM